MSTDIAQSDKSKETIGSVCSMYLYLHIRGTPGRAVLALYGSRKKVGAVMCKVHDVRIRMVANCELLN